MRSAFISYSRRSEEFVPWIAGDLKRCGFDEIWWDKNLTGGQNWWNEILQQIRDADVLVCVVDADAKNSLAVTLEYKYASALGKAILPVLRSGDVNFAQLPPELSGIQYVDYRRENPDPLARLFDAVEALSEPAALPVPLPEPPPLPRTEQDSLAARVGGPEPLDVKTQNATLTELRRLYESDKAEEQEFAKECLLELLQKPELNARVADDINALILARKPVRNSGWVLLAGAVSVLAFIGLLSTVWIGKQSSQTDSQASPDIAMPVDPAARVPVPMVTAPAITPPLPSSGDTDKGIEQTGVAGGTGEQVDDLVDRQGNHQPQLVAEPVIDKGDEPDIDGLTTEPQRPVNQTADTPVATNVEGTVAAQLVTDPATQPTAEQAGLPVTQPVTQLATPAVDIPLATQAEPVVVDQIGKVWARNFSVFSESVFSLCGYSDFTASAAGASKDLIIRSDDRSIPDQPFRGLRQKVKTDELVELIPGCHVQFGYENISGIERISVQEKGK